jgi:hypothetical protein
MGWLDNVRRETPPSSIRIQPKLPSSPQPRHYTNCGREEVGVGIEETVLRTLFKTYLSFPALEVLNSPVTKHYYRET